MSFEKFYRVSSSREPFTVAVKLNILLKIFKISHWTSIFYVNVGNSSENVTQKVKISFSFFIFIPIFIYRFALFYRYCFVDRGKIKLFYATFLGGKVSPGKIQEYNLWCSWQLSLAVLIWKYTCLPQRAYKTSYALSQG